MIELFKPGDTFKLNWTGISPYIKFKSIEGEELYLPRNTTGTVLAYAGATDLDGLPSVVYKVCIETHIGYITQLLMEEV